MAIPPTPFPLTEQLPTLAVTIDDNTYAIVSTMYQLRERINELIEQIKRLNG